MRIFNNLGFLGRPGTHKGEVCVIFHAKLRIRISENFKSECRVSFDPNVGLAYELPLF